MTHLQAAGDAVRFRWAALVLLCAANFAVLLDSQSVILALPSLAPDLGMAPADAQWVLSAKLITFGGLLILGGRAADHFGRRRVFILGTGLFLVGSVLCGLAWSPAVIITARALSGIAAALMVPTALSILMNTFPEGKSRNTALAGWSGIGGIGATAGLLVGGLLTQTLGWQWVFYVNVPIAVLVMLLAPVLLRESRDSGKRRSQDVAGAVISTLALVAIILAVVQAPVWGWTSAATLILFAVAAGLLALFVAVEKRSASPLVPLALIKRPALAGGNLVTVAMGMAAFGLSVTISMYGQVVLGYSPLEFGVLQSVMPTLAFVGAYVGQSVVTRLGFRPVVAACLVLLGAGCLLLARVPVDGSYVPDILWGLVVFGPGLGAGMAAASVAALSKVPQADSGAASGINVASFQIGGALGVAVVTSVSTSFTAAPGGPAEFTVGLRAAFIACVAFAVIGLGVTATLLRGTKKRHLRSIDGQDRPDRDDLPLAG
ncbi:MFS transporter [Amycolatopsis orientalis]|uniref:MFS transporter n=1 Tax=Amycolatopsis orientalis TaxID=31958 RepID=A0A193BSC6_AMYOR|nr:MFS transporter [Amycolatopsis orientalis]ANN15111.1 MFS transporter [Amycolatopsis orientalis]